MTHTDTLLQSAEDIFFELAPENLSEQKIALLQANPKALFIEISEGFSDTWEGLIYEAVDDQEYIEIKIYLDLAKGLQRLALILIGIDAEHDKECHIQW